MSDNTSTNNGAEIVCIINSTTIYATHRAVTGNK